MRDDSHKWDIPNTDEVVFSGPQINIQQIQPARQQLVSGVNVLQDTTLPLVGWPGNVSNDAYALVLRRDRILEINGTEKADGWHAADQCAVSDMTHGYAVITIDGQGALELLKRGSFIDPAKQSRSVARSLFGLPAMLYRRAESDSYVVHVERQYAQTLRKTLLTLITENKVGCL